MYPNTGLGPEDVRDRAILVCGEDARDVMGGLEKAGARAREVLKYREFQTFDIEGPGPPVTLCIAGIGSASVEIALTELFFCGARCFVLSGTCGSLSPEFPPCSLVLLNRAERHDGASFHYMPEGASIRANPRFLKIAGEALSKDGFDFKVGSILSTDSFYCMGATLSAGKIVYPGVPLKDEFHPPAKFNLLKEKIERGEKLLVDMETAAFYTLCSVFREEVFNVAVKAAANYIPFRQGQQAANTSLCVEKSVAAGLLILKEIP